MSKISDRIKTTLVKIFINSTAVAAIMTAPLTSVAQRAAPSPSPSPAASPAASPTQAGVPIQLPPGTYYDADAKKMERCDSIQDKINESNRKIAEACRKSGLGGSSNCVSKAKTCEEKLGEEEEGKPADTLSMLATTLGVPANASGVNSECPQLNGRDYFSEKDKIEESLKKAKEDIAALDEDRADAQKDYNRTMDEIQKDLTEAQEKAKEENLKTDEDTQKSIADFNEANAKAAKELREKGTQALSLQGQLDGVTSDKASQLIDLTQDQATFECMMQVQERNKNYNAVSSGSNSGHISKGNSKKQYLLDVYNNCMKKFYAKRAAITKAAAQKRELVQKLITDNQADMTAIDDALKQSETQLDTIKKNGDARKANAIQSVIDLGNRSQTNMQAAKTQLDTTLQGLAKKEAALNEAVNSANKSLLTLGAPPKSRATDYSPGEASSEIDGEMDALRSYASNRNICEEAKNAAAASLKKYGESTRSGRSRGTN